MTMRVHILGCGTSSGVPRPFFGYGEGVDEKNPKNNRTRSSVAIEKNNEVILIDTSPDLRGQILRQNLSKISAVLFTHAHADHCHGIDDLRWACAANKAALPIYGNYETIEQLQNRFDYCFTPITKPFFYKPVLIPNVINKDFTHQDIAITSFEQDHGYSTTLGFRIDNFAYSTDVKTMPQASLDQLHGLDLWVVDCLQIKPHETHAHLAQTLEWIAEVKPKRALLTHINYGIDYEYLLSLCPKFVSPAYDGLIVDLPCSMGIL